MLRAIEWILLGTVSCAAIIGGVLWRRPARVCPWLLLAGAIATISIGDVHYTFGSNFLAEIWYLAMFALVSAALVQFTRGGSVVVDRARMIDLLACTCAASLVCWVFVISSSGAVGEISAADVLGDLLLVGVATRLVRSTGRNVSAALLLVGAVGVLFSDLTYPLLPDPLTEAGYVVLYLAWGLAAVHPSMRGLTEPRLPQQAPLQGRWIVLLGISVATPPIVLLAESLVGPVKDGVVIAVAAALTLTLTITRLADSIGQHRSALARERGLRIASAALVSAADTSSVDAAVQAAVAELMPTNTPQVLLNTDDQQTALWQLPAAQSGPRPRSWWTEQTADRSTLVCPLWLEPLAVARPSGGALILTGRNDVLSATRDALEVLAGQAALAVDRISLVQAVGRRDSDLYLRAVIHNTADLMLVIDEDQRIRYASPALRELLSDEQLSPLATLTDLVHPDDRGQIRRALQADGDGSLFCSLRRLDHSQVLVEATYRDLRTDRLVQGFVVTLRIVTEPNERAPHLAHVDELPAWVNRRSAQHKFRY